MGLVFSLSLCATAQNLDSLMEQLSTLENDDTARISLTLIIADQLFTSNQKETIRILDDFGNLINRGSLAQKADAAHYRAAAYQYLHKFDSLEHYQELSLDFAVKDNDSKRQARAYANLATAYRKKGELDKAAEHYELARSEFEKLGEQMPIASISNGLGLVHHARGDYQNALEAYQRALRIFQEEGHKKYEAIMLNNIGRVHNSQKNYDKALEYYKGYLRISSTLKDSLQMSTAYNNIGSLFIDIHQLDSSRHYLEQGMALQKNLSDHGGLSTSLNNLGKVYNLMQEYLTGKEYNEEAFRLSTLSQDKKTQAFSLLELSKSYFNLNNPDKARSNANTGLQLALEMDDKNLTFLLHEQLYRILKSSNPEIALSHLEIAFTLKDTLLNQENIEALTTMELQYAFDKKELVQQQRIDNLELQEKYRIAQLRNQYFAIAGLILGLLGLTWFFIQLRSRNRMILAQNELINRALEEKNILLKEIHHRVKNNLQVISSLLGIQSRKVKDKAAVDALKEGRTRVQSMSLIHQDLYKHDDLKGISIREYFDKLVRNLFDTYNLHREAISIEAEIDDLLLDIDTIIPLGLILNELISNALKYAFPHNTGEVEVTLKEKDNKLHLMVLDDGVGIDNPNKVISDESFGYDLILSLVDKLEGHLDISIQGGTKVEITLSNYKKAAEWSVAS